MEFFIKGLKFRLKEDERLLFCVMSLCTEHKITLNPGRELGLANSCALLVQAEPSRKAI